MVLAGRSLMDEKFMVIFDLNVNFKFERLQLVAINRGLQRSGDNVLMVYEF